MFHYLCKCIFNAMYPISINDSTLTERITQDSLVSDSISNMIAPFLSGDVPHEASAYVDISGQLLLANQPAWYFMILFLLFASIAVSQIYFKGLLQNTFQTVIRYSVTVGMFNDNSQVQRQKDNILYAIYFISFAMFILVLENRWSLYPYDITGFRLFLWNIAFLLGIFYTRIFLLNVVAHIFKQRKLFQEYLYHVFSLNKLFGIISIPLVFLLIYTENTINEICFILAISMFLMMIIMKAIKGFIFSIEKHVFNFYLFLYLCALEIVPILLMYKWITTVV